MATKLILGFFLKSTKKMSEDDMPPYGSEALLGSDEAGTASKRDIRHHLLAETRRDIRQMTVLGVEAIQQAVAAKAYYHASACAVVTTSYFTRQAKKLARVNDCTLIDRDRLALWIVAFQSRS